MTLSICGQSHSDLLKLYKDGEMEQLQQLKTRGEISDPGWPEFIDALFIADAESAIRSMYNAYALTTERSLKEAIRERIAQYYSSRGYYISATRILEEEDYFIKMMALKSGEMLEAAARQNNTEVQNDVSGQQGTSGLRLSDALKSGRFGIQVGAFGTRQNAERLMRKYRKSYPDAKVIEKRKNGQALHLVVIGEYANRAKAQEAALKIYEKLNVKGYIIDY